jgi:hypothetical protein
MATMISGYTPALVLAFVNLVLVVEPQDCFNNQALIILNVNSHPVLADGVCDYSFIK